MVEINRAAGQEIFLREPVSLDKLRLMLEDFLRNYPMWRAEVTFEDERLAEAWPIVVTDYNFSIGDNLPRDQVASCVARRMGTASEVRKKVQCVNTFLDSLDDEGRRFVEARYFKRYSKRTVAEELKISEYTYRAIRVRVVDGFLYLLGFDVVRKVG